MGVGLVRGVPLCSNIEAEGSTSLPLTFRRRLLVEIVDLTEEETVVIRDRIAVLSIEHRDLDEVITRLSEDPVSRRAAAQAPETAQADAQRPHRSAGTAAGARRPGPEARGLWYSAAKQPQPALRNRGGRFSRTSRQRRAFYFPTFTAVVSGPAAGGRCRLASLALLSQVLPFARAHDSVLPCFEIASRRVSEKTVSVQSEILNVLFAPGRARPNVARLLLSHRLNHFAKALMRMSRLHAAFLLLIALTGCAGLYTSREPLPIAEIVQLAKAGTPPATDQSTHSRVAHDIRIAADPTSPS
jgi:hypothetical protein